MAVVGIDACKLGWVAVVLEDGLPPIAHLLRTIGAIEHVLPHAATIAIDIPIGLPDVGARHADLAARNELGGRRSSVFVTPVRAALEASTHAEATRIASGVNQAGISQQAFALRSKIFEVEEWLRSTDASVIEVHPEVSFATMLGRPALASKKTWHGMRERLAALEREGIVLDHIGADVGMRVAVDDLVDAAAAAWSARRWVAGLARSFPAPPPVDHSGRAIAIWA